MRKTHAPYPPEFREEAVRLVRQSGKSIRRVAKELGVSDQSLRNWVKRATMHGVGVQPDSSPRPLKGDNEQSVSDATGVLKTANRKPAWLRILPFLLAIILGVVTGVEIHRTNIAQRFSAIHDITRSRSTLSSLPVSQSAISPDALAGAWKMLSEGRLQEAQDMFLEILQAHPYQQRAWRGLVTVRHQIAHDDPVVLRQQTRVYEEAIKRGTDTEEHYTPSAMELLVTASDQAADEIESQSDPSHQGVR
jgi:transposase-like protein